MALPAYAVAPTDWRWHAFPLAGPGIEPMSLDVVARLGVALLDHAAAAGDQAAFGPALHWAHVLKLEQGAGGDWPTMVNARTGEAVPGARTTEPAVLLARLGEALGSVEFDDAVSLARRVTVTEMSCHRQHAVDLFNYVWTLLDKPVRTVAEDDAMLHAAHASRHHWGEVGAAVNLARGEWQVSRVYAVLGRGEPALYHARRCLDICEANGIGDWDVAFAHEAMARAYRVAGDVAAARASLERAHAASMEIADPEDRDVVLKDLATIGV